ncbi:RNA-binding protein [Methylopila jiangsuensis]|uniref:RNA-binding protein n=1 Tax=Methylopila jiangsuensis TaxID=586230 RepID=A0A9W6JEA7_9HYPH|nr:RNA-binding protein [Methylopila jiangsuensis]
MKALSIVAPGGSWIASGLKTLEVRRWKPELHPDEDVLIVENKVFLRQDGDEDDAGRVVALARVAVVRPFMPEDMAAACASSFEDGWLSWELTHVRPVTSAIAVKAARGIYELAPPTDIRPRS